MERKKEETFTFLYTYLFNLGFPLKKKVYSLRNITLHMYAYPCNLTFINQTKFHLIPRALKNIHLLCFFRQCHDRKNRWSSGKIQNFFVQEKCLPHLKLIYHLKYMYMLLKVLWAITGIDIYVYIIIIK